MPAGMKTVTKLIEVILFESSVTKNFKRQALKSACLRQCEKLQLYVKFGILTNESNLLLIIII
jgi:hypothetical protein